MATAARSTKARKSVRNMLIVRRHAKDATRYRSVGPKIARRCAQERPPAKYDDQLFAKSRVGVAESGDLGMSRDN